MYAKGIDIDGNDSEIAEQRINNIDSTGPEIIVTGDLETPKQRVTLLIRAKDDGEVDSLLYEVGSKKMDYFQKNGNGLKNPSTITIEENGIYTFYAIDALGNETIKEIEVTNIDKTAPDITINVLSTTVGTSTEVEIDYGDAVTKFYKVGESGKYQSYKEKFTLSSYDLFDLKNEDGSLTIYAKGIDEAGNEQEVKEITYVLDLNKFEAPVINASDGYPMLTSTGMILGRPSYIAYDTNTTDVTNYYSTDNGVTWTEYTGGITLASGDIIAKSVRESTGLEFTSNGKVTIPTNAVGEKTYDKDLETSEKQAKNTSRIFTVNNNLYGEKIKIYTGNTVSTTSTIKMYDKNKTLLSTTETVGVLTIVEIPEDTYYVEINSGSDALEVREIELQGSRNLIGEYTPIIKINEGGWAPEKVATITYYNEEYQNEYSIDNGATWNTYKGPIKLIEPTNVIARTIREEKVIGASNFIVTRIDPTEPVIELEIGNKIQLGYDLKVPTYYKETPSGTTVECKDGNKVVTNLNELTEGEHTIKCTAITGAGRKASVEKNIKVIQLGDIEANSILEAISSDDVITGRYSIKVAEEVYSVHVFTLEGNQHFTENKTFGDAKDVATEDTYAQNMVIVKVNGDLEIDEGVTVAPYYDESYGGPKGFTLYVTGKLTNKGTIDNSHGAKAEGQNVYLWKNTDGTYEYVPAEGGSGSVTTSRQGYKNGVAGIAGSGRQTGGGGSGYLYTGTSTGGAGTSYSGGTGGGNLYSGTTTGSPNGGAGGDGVYAGGAGNPGGKGNNKGANGTGGLLVIYAAGYENLGTISAVGANGGAGGTMGAAGSSGGGSINIFTNQSTGIDQLGIITDTRYNELLGTANKAGGIGVNKSTGGAGGEGTLNIGEIRNGQYYDLKEIIEQDKEKYKESVTIKGESILSIINSNNLKTGYYYFIVNGENYPIHMITLEGNQHFTENKIFGDAKDVATENDYAQNMVIVKVNGDLEIDEGVTVAPYYDESYGGPKGFTLYVTGKLTNKGTIDNSHGAKAEGQNVYLWKNTDGTYEYVPAEGGSGSVTTSRQGYKNGVAGIAGSGRQTGGGGSGYLYTGTSTGGAGTSYSGGTGGGNLYSGTTTGSPNGGAGGDGVYAGGAGNPGGKGNNKGANGTGGLLVIYAAGYENLGTISAVGANGGAGGTMGAAGSSGGGSINIFTNQIIEDGNKGLINVSGGIGVNNSKGGAGGSGTVTFTQLQPISITSSYSYPNILLTKTETEKYEITINYFSTISKKLYSIDNGSTWLEYKDSFFVEAETIVQAKGINSDKTETDVITYTVSSLYGIPYKTFDGNMESGATLQMNRDYEFTVSKDTIGKSLRFYLGSEPSSDATIKIYDKDNVELLNTTFVNNLTVINIPDDSYKFIINAGSKELTINEINIRKELEKEESLPDIVINDINWSTSKTIEVIYPEGYKNEYSLDLGNTWIEYTEPITITEETVIFTRILKDGKVAGSSSYVITSIDNVEPEISLDLDESIDKDTDIKLPTNYVVGKSGGTAVCKIGEIEVTNTNELEVGTYEITCIVTNGANISKSITKNVTIKEKEEQTTEPTTEETTNP